MVSLLQKEWKHVSFGNLQFDIYRIQTEITHILGNTEADSEFHVFSLIVSPKY